MKLPAIIHSEIIAASRLFSIESLELEFSNGAQRTFERLPKRGREAVIICAVTEDREVVLVREYMAGLHKYELGLPKGRVDEGESLEHAADRELQEEAGFGARNITHLRELSLAPGQMGFSIHSMLALDLYPQSLEGDEPEPLEVVLWPLNRVDELIFSHELSEARSIATLKIAEVALNGGQPATPTLITAG
ncbi:MAG: ADP compounds hydrolase NudE [Gammaproteobacteria bacterium]|nr:ADP compounds hydrolase NudE [Gammaproteobacteria bacterium]